MSVVGGALVSAFGGLLVLAGVKQLFTAVSVSRSENVPVRNVASRDGLVEFDGRAEAPADEGAFEAPFSGEEALYCDLWMKAKSDHGSGAHSEGIHLGDSEPHDHDDTVNANDSWGLAESGDVRQAFVVEEGGTRVSVDPEGASFDIEGHMGESVLGVGEDSPLSEEVRDRLARLDEMDPEFDGSLVVQAPMGEETGDPGTRALLDAGHGGDCAVVLEPTGLRVATAAKGVATYRIGVDGVASHASRPDQGRNAVDAARLDRVPLVSDPDRQEPDPVRGVVLGAGAHATPPTRSP